MQYSIFKIQDTRYKIQDIGCWMRDAGARFSALDTGQIWLNHGRFSLDLQTVEDRVLRRMEVFFGDTNY